MRAPLTPVTRCTWPAMPGGIAPTCGDGRAASSTTRKGENEVMKPHLLTELVEFLSRCIAEATFFSFLDEYACPRDCSILEAAIDGRFEPLSAN